MVTNINISHGQKSVPGVGEAKCIPLWNGPGTVKVVIVDADSQVAPIELIQKVQKFIDDVKPIGATLTVSTAEEITINISSQSRYVSRC